MVQEPQAAATAPANRKLSYVERTDAYMALLGLVDGKLESIEAKTIVNQINFALGNIDETSKLQKYLEDLNENISRYHKDRYFPEADKKLISDGLKLLAKKCGVELQALAEAR